MASSEVAMSGSRHWRRLHTLGRGASGAVVSLAADAASGELFAVKSAGAAAMAALRREQAVLSGLSSPHVVRCAGGAEAADGSYQLFLEYAPGGSLADEVARNGGALPERAVGAYAADVLRGLAYLHGRSVVHGDVKPRNVVIGGDGRAKLADFGCARAAVGSTRPIGGTPAFMAPEVARGEEQGPAADVWALGCTVVQMATGRAPWSDMDDVLAALHRIGHTDAVPEVPFWLSPEAKDFLACCFARDAVERWTAAELLEHPFVTFTRTGDEKAARWVSPKSTLDAAAFWDSESDEDEAEEKYSGDNAAERIKSLACAASAFTDWEDCCEEGWIDVLGDCEQQQSEEVQVARGKPSKVSVPAGGMAVGGGGVFGDELAAEDVPFGGHAPAADASVGRQSKRWFCSAEWHVLSFQLALRCNGVIDDEIKLWFATKIRCAAMLNSPCSHSLLTPNFSCVCERGHDRFHTQHCTLLGCNTKAWLPQIFTVRLCLNFLTLTVDALLPANFESARQDTFRSTHTEECFTDC